MAEEKDLPSAETLRELYWDKGMTLREIGLHYGLSESTIHKRMEELGVPRRAAGPQGKDFPPAEELRELYWDKGMTLREIGLHYGLSENAVYKRMETLGIPRRSTGPRSKELPSKEELQKLYWEEERTLREIGDRYEVSADVIRRRMKFLGINRRAGGGRVREPSSAEELRRLYWDERLTMREIGERFGVSRQRIHQKMEALGIPRRSAREAAAKRYKERPPDSASDTPSRDAE